MVLEIKVIANKKANLLDRSFDFLLINSGLFQIVILFNLHLQIEKCKKSSLALRPQLTNIPFGFTDDGYQLVLIFPIPETVQWYNQVTLYLHIVHDQVR